jgi:hypothetical protein
LGEEERRRKGVKEKRSKGGKVMKEAKEVR